MALVLQSRETQLGESFQSFEFEVVDITLETSYVTGGSALAALVGEGTDLAVGPEGSSTGNIVAALHLGNATPAAVTSVICQYHPETDKLQCFWTGAVISTALAEVTAATNLSAIVARFLVIGRAD